MAQQALEHTLRTTKVQVSLRKDYQDKDDIWFKVSDNFGERHVNLQVPR